MNRLFLLGVSLNLATSVWLLLLILLPLGWLWVTQFIQLMLMSERDFPGRNDRQLWVIAFIIVFFFAPFAFWGWKAAYLDQLDAEDEQEIAAKNSQKPAPSS